MSKRRKKIEHTASETPPRLSGAALLISEIPEAKLDLHGLSAREAEVLIVGVYAGKGVHTHAQKMVPNKT